MAKRTPLVPPDELEAAQITRSIARTLARRRRYRVEVTGVGSTTRIEPPYADMNSASARIMDAFGTTSPEFATHLVDQISSLSRPWGGEQPDGKKINAALAYVDGLEPANEMEAMAALLLYATTDLALSMMLRAKRAETVPELELSGCIAAKLSRTATAQMEALAKLRRGGEQVVRVEHVHVYAGGQAIVGNVSQGGGRAQKIKDQSHEPNDTPELVAPLLGVDEAGDVVSVAGHGERAVQAARRQGGRSIG